MATLTGSDLDWSTAAVAPGTYTIYLDLANGLGLVTSPPMTVTVLPDPRIFVDGFEAGDPAAVWAVMPEP